MLIYRGDIFGQSFFLEEMIEIYFNQSMLERSLMVLPLTKKGNVTEIELFHSICFSFHNFSLNYFYNLFRGELFLNLNFANLNSCKSIDI